MNKDLEKLIKLSKFDLQIKTINKEKLILEADLNTKLAIKASNDEAIIRLEEIIKTNHLKRLKNEGYLEDLKLKLQDIDRKMNHIKNQKELKSLQLEEDITKDQITQNNMDIDRFEKIEIAKKEEIKNLKAENLDLEAAAEKLRETTRSQNEVIESKRDEVLSQKAIIAETISESVIQYYNKIKEWAHESAVVPVQQQVCLGCHIKINMKTYTDLLEFENIIYCHNCGRVLYLDLPKDTNEELPA